METTEVKSPESKVKAEPDFSGVKLQINDRLYMLHYRQGTKKPDWLVFRLPAGSLQDAINKSRWFCEEMDFRFCGCFAFVRDLDVEVKNKTLLNTF